MLIAVALFRISGSCQFRDLYASADEMAEDGVAMSSIRTWARKTRLSNMHLERDLALMKKASPAKHPVVERYAACGHLAKVLRLHRDAGGIDPRSSQQASDLVDSGVHLARAAKPERTSCPPKARGVFKYISDNMEPGLSAEQRRAARRRLGTQFGNEPLDVQNAYRSEEMESALAKQDIRMGQVGERAERKCTQYVTAIGDSLWGKSTRCEPVRLACVSEVIDYETPAGARSGMRNYSGPLRDKFRDRLVIIDDVDNRAIDPDNQLIQKLPCCLAHPGLCPEKTPDIYVVGVKVQQNLTSYLVKFASHGDYIRLRCIEAGTMSVVDYFYSVAYVRKSHGRAVVCFEASLEDDWLVLRREGETLLPPRECSQIAVTMLTGRVLESIKVAFCSLIPDERQRTAVRCEQVQTDGAELLKGKFVIPRGPKAEPPNVIEAGFNLLQNGDRQAPQGRGASRDPVEYEHSDVYTNTSDDGGGGGKDCDSDGPGHESDPNGDGGEAVRLLSRSPLSHQGGYGGGRRKGDGKGHQGGRGRVDKGRAGTRVCDILLLR